MIPRIVHVDDVAARAAELFVESLLASVRARDRFTVCLAGGGTPLPAYQRLAQRSDLPWDRVHAYLGDERFVPETDAASNFGSIRSTLLDHVPIPTDQVHPWPILADPEASVAAYARLLDETMGGRPFDLTLLGLGADGHTAGIFPHTGKTDADTAAVASRPDGVDHARLSMTPRRLSESRTVAFLVTGDEKRAALEALVAADGEREAIPARAIAAMDRLWVLTDLDLET